MRDLTPDSQPIKHPSLNEDLGELLVERGKLEPDKLQQARRLEQDSGERLGPLKNDAAPPWSSRNLPEL